jgi:hypothetical protein
MQRTGILDNELNWSTYYLTKQELEHFYQINNRMSINLDKTKEIILHRRSPKNFVYPAPLCGILQIKVAKLLGVFIGDYSTHVNTFFKLCGKYYIYCICCGIKANPGLISTLSFKPSLFHELCSVCLYGVAILQLSNEDRLMRFF